MNTALQALIDAQKQQSFTDPSTATDAEALGILISQHFEWTVEPILRTAEAALEDSNYHTAAEAVGALADRLESKEVVE